jgi:hypothetical protein
MYMLYTVQGAHILKPSRLRIQKENLRGAVMTPPVSFTKRLIKQTLVLQPAVYVHGCSIVQYEVDM